jgi:hypothetical protein
MHIENLGVGWNWVEVDRRPQAVGWSDIEFVGLTDKYGMQIYLARQTMISIGGSLIYIKKALRRGPKREHRK